MGVKLLSVTENLLQTVATAARVCYSGLPVEELLTRYSEEEQAELVKRVVGMGHLSVIEHGVMTLFADSSFKEELFRIMVEKPYLKITEREDGFIVSLNLRTAYELMEEMPHLRFVEELQKVYPAFLPKPKNQR